MIDSAEKRRAASSVGQVWAGVGVTPDATAPAGWRQVVGFGWFGILVGGAVPTDGTGDVAYLLRRTRGVVLWAPERGTWCAEITRGVEG